METNKEINYDSLETKGHTIQTIRTDKPLENPRAVPCIFLLYNSDIDV